MPENAIANAAAVLSENVRCAVCGEQKTTAYLKAQQDGQDYSLVQCASCGLVYLNPRPTESSIDGMYTADDPEKAGRKPAFYEQWYFRVFRNIPLRKKGKMLDIGCGVGRYIYCMRQLGWTVQGVDISATEYGRKELGLDIFEGDIRSAGFADESFNAVTLWWTLEHMRDPLAMLKEAYRLVKRGGVVVVGVQNIASLEARLFGQDWFHLFLPRHLYHFTPATLAAALARAGFARTEVRHDLFTFGLFGSIQNRLNRHGIKISFKNPVCYALSLPIDAIFALSGGSGLMTAYAYKE